MVEKKAKRVRRGFGTIILQKFDSKSNGLDEKKYQHFRTKLENLIGEFEKLQADAKKATKIDKRKLRSLKKFSKEEIEEYLKTLKK